MKVGRGRQWGQNLHRRWNLLRNGGQDLLYILFSAGIGFKIEMLVIQLQDNDVSASLVSVKRGRKNRDFS